MKEYHSSKHSSENDILFSRTIKAGKRIYYVDVKRNRKDELYLAVTESKKIVEGGDALNPQFTFQKHKIFLYKEDYEKFAAALQKTIDIAKGAPIPEPAENETSAEESKSDGGLDINFDF